MAQSGAGRGVTLDARLLRAHEAHDPLALIGLYIEAADAVKDAVAHRFYLTHAYVFALETGDSRAEDLHARLGALGAV